MATILAASTGFPEQVARAVLAFYHKGIVPRQAELNVKGVGEMIAIMAQAGVLKPPLPAADRFVDLQCLEAAGVR